MKKFSKLLLALGGISAVGAGLAVGMVNNNVKAAEPVKATGEVTLSGGCAFYLTPNSNWKTLGWFSIYFFNGSNNAFSDVMTAVPENSDGVYETNVPSGTWTTAIALRLKANSKPTSFSDAYDQTNDMNLYYTSGTNVSNGITIAGDNWNKGSSDYMFYYNPVDRINLWSTGFLTATNVCDSTGVTNNISANSWKIWNDQSAAFGVMGSEPKALFAGAAGDATSATSYIAAAARYDYICTKYSSAANFASRTIAGRSAAIVSSNNMDSSSTIVLGGLAAVAVLAAGGYFFVRKKKNA